MKLSYFYMMLALTVVDIILLAVSIKNSDKKAVKSFSIVVMLIIISHIFYGASLIISTPAIKFTVHELKFIGIAFFSAGFYMMYMDLFDKREMLPGKRKILLAVVPAISVLLAVTNNYHHLFRTRMYIIDNNYGSFIGVQSGPLFWVYILYSYSLYIFVIGVIINTFLKTPRIYRMRLGIMIFAAVSTLLINFVSISNIFFEDFGDATLISFTFAAVIQFYGLVLYKPVGMIRIARDMAVNEIKDPLVIFDYENRFLDANNAAREIFSFTEGEALSEFLERQSIPKADYGDAFKRGDKWYTVKQKNISDDDGVFSVSAVLLSDITEIKRREQELQNLANHDYLTGIANRHAYLRELKNITDKDLPVAVVRFYIRGLKLINIRYGSEAGDNIVTQVANTMALVGESAFCARIGGAEFALLLRNTTEAGARSIIEDINSRLPGIALVSGLAVKQSNMDNINIIDKISMDALNMNKLLARSEKLL